MDIKLEIVYAYVRSGLLQSSSRKVCRRTEQTVKALILEEFEQRYILGRDIARLLGRSPRAVAEILLADGVRLVAGPGVDKCRQNVFQRDAIDECHRRHGVESPVQTGLRQGHIG